MKTNFEKPKGQETRLEDNVQKTVLRAALIITSFVLISLTVSAQDFWKNQRLNSSSHEIALVLTNHSGETAERGKTRIYTTMVLDAEKDETLMLEQWMTNQSLFGFPAGKLSSTAKIPFRLEEGIFNKNRMETTGCAEEPLLLKSWMISERVWRN